ncbi:tryptophan--trna ligase mitochondrial [Holotrichia oblita]|nr:tryptophan--trna ligase mitochondrial [Holotrichia oblita]
MKLMLSGIKPTGRMTLGNYLGAIKEWVKIQNDYHLYIFIANLHAITLPIDREELIKNSKEMLALLLACGIDHQKVTIFLQSDVPMHAELGYIISTESYIGELSRMHQYKDYINSKKIQNIPTGIFIYPTLMAADIFLYDADYVPVGADQKQHVELARDIAIRVNNRYGKEIFKVSAPYIPKYSARIMSLSNPDKKMSKSDEMGEKGCIYLTDDLKLSSKKIMQAVTDLGSEIKYDIENKPGISNLMAIYSALTGLSINEIENKFNGQLYGTFKKELASVLVNELTPIQEKFQTLLKDDKFLKEVLSNGALKAQKKAKEKLDEVKTLLGLNLF